MIATWLDARDPVAREHAWTALDAKLVSVGDSTWRLCAAGVARFAAAFLDWPIERVAIITAEDADRGPPTATASAGSVSSSSLDGRTLNTDPCFESLRIWEVRDGDRGIQRVSVDATWDSGQREPDGRTVEVIRVFAGDRAVSIDRWYGHDAYVIGDVDLAALDLFEASFNFGLPWTAPNPEGVHALLAQLSGECGPGYYAVRLDETRWIGGDSRMRAELIGLPREHDLSVWLDTDKTRAFGGAKLRMPIELGNRVIARLTLTPGFDRTN